MSGQEHVIKKPRLSEKATEMTDKLNRYCFLVDRKASKFQIKDAVEKFYDVKVVGVKTAVMPGKLKRAGKRIKKSGSYKKAYIQVSEGQKIDFFKNV